MTIVKKILSKNNVPIFKQFCQTTAQMDEQEDNRCVGKQCHVSHQIMLSESYKNNFSNASREGHIFERKF